MSSQRANVSSSNGFGPLSKNTEAPCENGGSTETALRERVSVLEMSLAISQDQVADLDARAQKMLEKCDGLEEDREEDKKQIGELKSELFNLRQRTEWEKVEARAKMSELKKELERQTCVTHGLEKDCVLLEEEKRLTKKEMARLIAISADPFLAEQNEKLQTMVKHAEVERLEQDRVREQLSNALEESRRIQKEHDDVVVLLEETKRSNEKLEAAVTHSNAMMKRQIAKAFAERRAHEETVERHKLHLKALDKEARRHQKLFNEQHNDLRNCLEKKKALEQQVKELEQQMKEKDELQRETEKSLEEMEEDLVAQAAHGNVMAAQRTQYDKMFRTLQAESLQLHRENRKLSEQLKDIEEGRVLTALNDTLAEIRSKDERTVETLLSQITVLQSEKQQMKEWCEQTQMLFQTTVQQANQQIQDLHETLVASDIKNRHEQEIHRMIFERLLVDLRDHETARRNLTVIVDQLPALLANMHEVGRLPAEQELPTLVTKEPVEEPTEEPEEQPTEQPTEQLSEQFEDPSSDESFEAVHPDDCEEQLDDVVSEASSDDDDDLSSDLSLVEIDDDADLF